MKKKPRHHQAVLMIYLLVLTGCRGFDEQLLYNKANRMHDAGKFAEAIELYNKLLDADPANKIWPDNAIIRYDLGMAYLDNKQRLRAQEQIQELKKMKRADLAEQLEVGMKRQEISR